MMGTIKIPYSVLCEVMFRGGNIEEYVSGNFPHLREDHHSLLCKELKQRFVPNFNRRWRVVSRNRSFFSNKYGDWLEGEFTINFPVDGDAEDSFHCVGRPKKSFDECGERSKRSKIHELRSSHSQTLIDAAASSLNANKTSSVFSADFALSLFTQAKLTKFQYEVIRAATKKAGHDIFPSYKKITLAKKNCYPGGIRISETSSEVPLQNLLDHTVERIFKTKTEEELDGLNGRNLILHVKWGFDGASGQNEFSQAFSSENEQKSDSNLFMTSLVPLRITSSENEDEIIWANPRPSSTRYCRALRFQYEKETPEIIRAEKLRVEEEIKNLQELRLDLGTRTITVTHVLHFTMLDGKVAQITMDATSASNCFICGARPSEMNNLTKVKQKPLKDEALKLGISPLHARIKFMEYVLHLSYNLKIQAWRTNKTTLPIKEAEKKRIQTQLMSELGIKIDIVKQGYGSSNTGNTSRRFFGNPSTVASVTGIDKNLIRRLATILEVINCSDHQINVSAFTSYAEETAALAVSLYPWYFMPVTVHKILIHGADIIESAALPIGLLSEEAQESRNKDYKHIRIHHTRKNSRIHTNEDIFHKILETSDPYITHLRPELKLKHLPASEEALALLSNEV